MQVVNDLRAVICPSQATAVTIGNFDGVHLAHRQLLRRLIESARALGAATTVVTFEPHPAKVLAPELAPTLLTSLSQKTRLIEKEGIDLLVVLPFTEELARLSPAEFVRKVLVEKLRAVAVLVGPNFRFGHRRAGDVKLLAELARREGFGLEVVPILEVRGEPLSSTRIRELLAEGHVHAAGRLLGRPYSISGPIVSGRGIGSKLTVPTLNLAPVREQLPRRGVYVTNSRLDQKLYESVTNVGYRPTFGEDRLTVESYLLDYQGEVRVANVEVEFLHRLRDEKKFETPALLKAQIEKDVHRSVKFFRLLKVFKQRLSRRAAPARAQA